MSLAVDNSIVNNPFEESSRWWDYGEGQLRQRKRVAMKVIDMRGNEVIRVLSLPGQGGES